MNKHVYITLLPFDANTVFVACLRFEKMTFHLRVLSWALIFITRLRFPPGKQLVKVIYKISNLANKN